MNQILDHSGPKKPKAPPNSNDIKKIIKIFAIVIAVFGVILVGFALFTIIKNSAAKKKNNPVPAQAEATITTEKTSDNTVIVKVTHSKTIETVGYAWDTNQFEVSKGTSGQTEMTLNPIPIPTGNHQLHVKVTDIDGTETAKSFDFYSESGIDAMEPKIDIVIQGTTVQIVATDETELSFITYSINGGPEQRIDASGDDKTRITKILSVKEGEATTITVKAVDTSNNEAKMEKTPVIYSKPEINVVRTSNEASEIAVTITCTTKITKILVYINDVERNVEPDKVKVATDDGSFKHTFRIKVTKPGTNSVKVKALTERDDVYAEYEGTLTNN